MRAAQLVRRIGSFLAIGFLGLSGLYAAELDVISAESRLEGGVYRLDAGIRVRLSRPVLEALHSGVPITLVYRVRLLRPRAYLWDEVSAEVHQRWRLEHHALSDRFVLTNLNTSAAQAFGTLEDALAELGDLRDFPVIDSKLLPADGAPVAELQAWLDTDVLPTPLRLQAIFDARWRLASDPYRWALTP